MRAFLVLGLLLAGCRSGLITNDVQTLEAACARFEACPGLFPDHDSCVDQVQNQLVIQDECLAAIAATTECSELALDSDVDLLCFPRCTGRLQKCKGDTLTLCGTETAQAKLVFRCPWICTGAPGESFEGYAGTCRKVEDKLEKCICY